jgi:hypothetical protein
MSELGPEGRAFLEATRRLDEPTLQDRQRIRAKTLAAIAGAGATGALATKAAAGVGAGAGPALAPSGIFGGWLGGAITGALLGLAVVGAGAAIERATRPDVPAEPAATAGSAADRPAAGAGSTVAPAARAAPASRPSPAAGRGASDAPGGSAAARDGDPPLRTAPAPRPAPSEPSSGAPEASAAPEAPPAPPANAMDEELAVLHRAQEALRAGNPDEAVRVLDRYDATHAGAALQEERRAARILAACKAGHSSQARADAERFLRERPDSPLGGRVRAACLDKQKP